MLVKELIKQLQKVPSNTPVYIEDEAEDFILEYVEKNISLLDDKIGKTKTSAKLLITVEC